MGRTAIRLGKTIIVAQGDNFRIAMNVGPGLHIVEVRGQNRQTTGSPTGFGHELYHRG